MEKVLSGIRILDFGRVVASAYCGTLLADMGADVIKVERPGGEFDRTLGPLTPDGRAIVYELITPRNKKSITLDTRKGEGRKILDELVKKADVLISGFTPGGNIQMGIDYERLKQVHPEIIMVAISGFGQTGPYKDRPAFDLIAQAESGNMSYAGFPGNPPTRSTAPYVDLSTSISGAYGAMLALFHKEKTGRGQLVDVAMMDIATSFVAAMGVFTEYTLMNRLRPQIGNNSYYNYTNAFQARDGWVVISAIGNDIWKRFVRVLGCDHFLTDPRLADDESRYYHREVIEPVVSKWVGQRNLAEVMELLEKNRVPCGRVNGVDDLIDDPQVVHREMLIRQSYDGTGTISAPGVLVKLSETPGKVETPAPALGEHNRDIYCNLLNYSPADLENLKQQGVI